jgi:hypothetical protein
MLNPPFTPFGINVKDFGATGNGTTDDSTAIQNAINAINSNRGGRVLFPQGIYRIATGLTCAVQGLELIGEGLPGVSAAQANGSTRILSDDTITALTLNNGGAPSHQVLGYKIRNLHFRAAAASTTGSGIVIQNCENFILEDVTCSDYIGGTGLLIDGKSGNAQYGNLHNYSAGDCLTGLKLQGTAPNGLRMFGGFFMGQGTQPRASSIGISVTSGDTLRLYGTVIQGYETGAYMNSAGKGSEMHGPRFEYCNTNLRIGANSGNFSLLGGSFVNTALTGGGTNVGIQVDAGATDTILRPNLLAGHTTPFSDAGTRTRFIDTTATVSNILGGDVAMTTNGTFYDGPSITLGIGTWLITGAISLGAGSSAIRQWSAKLWDGTTVYSQAVHEVTGTGAAGQATLPMSTIVTLAASATIKISATSTVNADTVKGTSFKGSFLYAVRIG